MMNGKRQLRVAALLDTSSVSGPGRQLAELALHLAAKNVALRVITFHREGQPRSPYLAYLENAGVDYAVVAERRRFDLRLIPRVRAALRDFRPDVIQTHGYKPTVLAFALRSAGDAWSWIAFMHGVTADYRRVHLYNWLERRLVSAADRVVVMSRGHQAALARLGNKVRVVHNVAIPLPEDRRSAAEVTALGAAVAQRPVIGVVARLSPEKGVDVFLRACRELRSENVEFTAIIAGDGPKREQLERLASRLSLTDRVRFVGTVTALNAFYAQLDLLVIPSRSEGLPNVLFEALQNDLPVVAARVGGIPEVLDSSAAGVLVSPGDARALARGMWEGLRLKSDLAAREARRTIIENFSPEQRARAHVDLYTELVGAAAVEGSA